MLQLKNSIPALSRGVKQLYNGSVSAKNGVKQYTDGVAQLYAGFPTAQKGVADYTQGIADIKAGMDAQLLTNNGKLTAGAKQVADGNEQLFKRVSDNYKTQIVDGFTAFGNTADISDDAKLSDACGEFVKALTAYSADDISAEPTLQKYVPNAVNALKSQATAQQTRDALTKLATGATLFNATYRLFVGSAQVASGVTDYTNGASAISGYLGEATKNNAALNSGMATIYGGLSQLYANNKALNSGMAQLSDGLKQLNSNVPTMSSGINQLYGGTSQLTANNAAMLSGLQQLKDGTQKLTDNNASLMDGVGQLSDGSGKLVDGSKQVSDGMNTLTGGIYTLLKGVGGK